VGGKTRPPRKGCAFGATLRAHSNLETLERDIAHFRKFVSNGTAKAPRRFCAPRLLEGTEAAVRIFAEEPTRLKMRKDIAEMVRLAHAAIETENRATARRSNETTNVDEAYEQLAHFLSVTPHVRDYFQNRPKGSLPPRCSSYRIKA
jgi:hypothetical protein